MREGGKVLQTVQLDRGCFACMLGGEDQRTLFIAANQWLGPDAMRVGGRQGQIVAVSTSAPHAGWP